MEAFIVCSHIEVYYITFFQGSSIRYSMANDLVDRCAAATGETIVIQRRWISIILDNVVMYNLIDLLCGYSWLDYCMTCV